MANFDSLSNELILNILSHLEPLDCFHAAISCRRTWQISEELVEKSRLTKLWGRLEFDLDWTEEVGEALQIESLRLFDAVCEDPRILQHLISIDIQSDNDILLDGAERIEARKRAAANSVAFKQVDSQRLRAAIDSPTDNEMLALLLSLAPNLENLHYKDCAHNEAVRNMIRACVLAWGSPSTPASKALRVLGNLEVASIEHWDTEGSIDLEFAQYFISLPALRSFSGRMVASSEEILAEMPGLPMSNVTSIEFNLSTIDVESLDVFLSKIAALERFHYEDGGAIVSEIATYNPNGIIDVLAKYAQHSLKHLYLLGDLETGEGEGRSSFAGLTMFPKLCELTLDIELLLGEFDSEPPESPESLDQGFYHEEEQEEICIAKTLPNSLEFLTLHSTRDARATLITLMEGKEEYVPRLKRLQFAWLSREKTEMEAIAAACKEVDVEYTGRYLGRY